MNRRSSTQEEVILLRKKARRRLIGAIALVFMSIGILWNIVEKTPKRTQTEPINVVQETGTTPPIPQEQTDNPPLGIMEPSISSDNTSTYPSPASATVTQSGTASASQTIPPSQPASSVTTKTPEQLLAEQDAEREREKRREEKRLAEQKRKEEAKRKAEEMKAKETAKPKKTADPAAILEGRDGENYTPPSKPKTEKPKESIDQAKSSQRVIIQLAALSDQEKVNALKTKLSGLSIQANFSKVQTSKGEVTRVRVGPFNNQAEAEAIQRKLSGAGLSGMIIPQ